MDIDDLEPKKQPKPKKNLEELSIQRGGTPRR